DPFWDACQRNKVAVHFHVRIMRKVAKPKPKGKRGDDLTGLANVGAADMITDMPEIISSGVHDRFPDLTWVAVETGSGWIPYILAALGARWGANRGAAPRKVKGRAELFLRGELEVGVQGGSLRRAKPPRPGRREPPLVDRLPAPRLRLAGDAAHRRRDVPRRA